MQKSNAGHTCDEMHTHANVHMVRSEARTIDQPVVLLPYLKLEVTGDLQAFMCNAAQCLSDALSACMSLISSPNCPFACKCSGTSQLTHRKVAVASKMLPVVISAAGRTSNQLT